MTDQEQFRANLYHSYINAGMRDQILIQEYIEIAERFVFNSQKITQSEFNAKIKELNQKVV